jgi:hypothetical protein
LNRRKVRPVAALNIRSALVAMGGEVLDIHREHTCGKLKAAARHRQTIVRTFVQRKRNHQSVYIMEQNDEVIE